MSKNTLRQSQVVGLYGPGAMIDLPERSVLVLGLDDWTMSGAGTFRIIEEPRLQRLLHLRLKDDARFAGDRAPELRTPPIDTGDPARPLGSPIKATVFPRWFACDALPGDAPNRRRLTRFQDLDVPKRLEHRGDDGKKRKASPLRFVCGCESGHLQDIEWRRVVHQNAPSAGASTGPCREPMWLQDTGTSADPRDTRITCDCGASLSLEELTQPGRLGPCGGHRPWLADIDPNPCTAAKGLRLLTRSATNTYFPQVARLISLPEAVDELAKRMDTVWSVIAGCLTTSDIQAARRFNPEVRANLEGISDDEVLVRIVERSGAGIGGSAAQPNDAGEDPRLAEFNQLASGARMIGENRPDALLHAETLNRAAWDPDSAEDLAGIASVVAVHRLREVACLYGFTRFEPAAVESEQFEDIGLAVEGAPLALSPSWLPAVEAFGEGVFVLFEPSAVAQWLGRAPVAARARQLDAGALSWATQRRGHGVPVADAPWQHADYVMAHSLSHALMAEVALDCGYPASALKERIYSLPRLPGQPARCGILIYTASAGMQGTLGGLVDVTRRFAGLLRGALERQRLCSSDPVCADHDPATATDDRTLHGAACHGCLLIAETSCEARNLHLDRALLVDTVGTRAAGFF